MKSYLCFYIDGQIQQLKTNFKTIDDINYEELLNTNNKTIINYKNFNFIIYYNDNNLSNINLCNIPFLPFEINGDYYIFKFDKDSNHILNFTEKQLLKLLDINQVKNFIPYYSSDDFD